ncbi:Fur family ferric uptake transcriptional regulator [Duganella sp. 3397]|uniref:Fur family transcriptional regulator n=1 Tax=Duganella sp. 3397 TaxID=2817732 RepID=UPI00285F90B7|nr:transcriptional repressor [Duganella sp. 3397]MDR7051226.1 Fur family ferric uptake transcriptional regulator [Duganella sp. 3397]
MERNTRQRTAIHQCITAAGRPLAPQEILEHAQQAVPGIGMATIYRNIKSLLESGEIAAVSLPTGGDRYEVAGHGHHHHFHCRACDKVFEVHACPGDMQKMAPKGFQLESHELTLYGLCDQCK